MDDITITEVTASSLDQVTALIKSSRMYKNNNEIWFRGQSRSDWPLSPSIFRATEWDRRERNLYLTFQRYAHGIQQHCPSDFHFLSWLELMQHHGLPTRLLDWSHSPLIGLYFAVEGWAKGMPNPALWMLDVAGLNHICTNRNVFGVLSIAEPFSERDHLLCMFNESLLPFDSAQYRNGIDSDRLYCAFMPKHSNVRIVAQQGLFTLHGNPRPLSEQPSLATCLTKINIDFDAIEDLKNSLSALGIRRRTLFPDLDNLALDLRTCKEYLP